MDEGLEEKFLFVRSGLVLGNENSAEVLVRSDVVGREQDGLARERGFDGVVGRLAFTRFGFRPRLELGVGTIGNELGFGDFGLCFEAFEDGIGGRILGGRHGKASLTGCFEGGMFGGAAFFAVHRGRSLAVRNRKGPQQR